ncbi:MAG: undecaprenyldiphospho-muramoylpentapeptide beta-N-acetylglucosaminyltransferase [Colwellia sp.]|nr:undecaprenyldiphospho-muramoylpentapeptide beta-N-acetylglucosaminyltransferase [Colwellia sp.]MCW8865977.1 undecaprenyldiphospho-muramoylpentapeptide beta-N-acetylglucosaminyltransferase [Colwellia sp.]MCW9082332.1 undecaprenyldiphospho-muramoylpentapeptide beta-N-acetylglucosaminyltransferase [Colwellia sp.]
MAGGTGGHIFPGLAVADMLKQEGWNIHWLGTSDRMEATIVPEHGYDISFINISGLRNKGILSWLKLPFKLMNSLWQGVQVMKAVKPDVVLGMGGYASGPGGLAAWLMKKPLVVHEQNAAAGLTNRLLSRIASKVCSAFPNVFGEKIAAQVVGNPLRASISEQALMVDDARTEETDKTSRNILVIGGSLGAQVLNQVVPESFAQLVKNEEGAVPFNIWHQTGKGKQTQVVAAYNQYHFDDEQVRVTEFIKEMASAYQWADIVICRAGALTVSELAMAAKPAIFVPLPHAVDDHQTENAQYLVSRGGASLIKQSELTSDGLAKMLAGLFSETQILNTMAQAAFAAADVNATRKVAQICQQLIPASK